jgi:hypothetical protein
MGVKLRFSRSEEYGVRLYESAVMRTTFGPKEKEVTGS